MEELKIFFIGIIFIIILKFYKFKKKEIKDNNPTLEYYEWKRIYYKMIVLHEFKEIYKKHINIHKNNHKYRWRNHLNSKSAYF